MKKAFLLFVATLFTLLPLTLQAKPIDMTGLSCIRDTSLGLQRWEFYGDVAVRSYEGQGQPQRFVRIGEGAYERYSRLDGEWDAIYYFFETEDGVYIRINSRPGLLTRDDNPQAAWERGVFPFAAECISLWEDR